MTTNTELVNCSRCGGTGKLAQYAHIAEGACFSCKGVGGFPVAVVERRAKDAKRREAKREDRATAFVIGRMRAAQAEGLTLPEFHAGTCSCAAHGTPCDLTQGRIRELWDAAAE